MDQKLVAWGRSVKRRKAGCWPPLWLFTDERLMTDVVRSVSALPAGLCGVVFRHDGVTKRARLLRLVAAVCRARRLALVVAGDARGAPAWAGRHLREGRGRRGRARPVTSSAHGVADLVRARRAGANLIFLSPAFPTASHPGSRSLGPVRWAAMARIARQPVLALGGVTGRTVRRLGRANGAGAIGGLSV